MPKPGSSGSDSPHLDAQGSAGCFLPDPRAEAQNDFCFGIIGGADGPVAIVAGEAAQEKLHTACSSLHFAAVDHVDWRVGFRETPWEAGTFDLL